MTDKIVFRTVHGSHLYGLSHANSDEDRMVVYADGRRARHRQKGKDDALHVGVYDLLEKAKSGSHQFMEGLFSPVKVYEDESFRELIENYRIPVGEVRDKYLRTIKKFSYGNTKMRRHAVRIGICLRNLRENDGRFNPRLSDDEIRLVHHLTLKASGLHMYNRIIEEIVNE